MRLPPHLVERVVALRRDLHQHPELSTEEHRTMERVAAELRDLGMSPRCGVAGTGIVVDLPGVHEGPRIGLRADTDALPIQERTGLPFASRNDGVMHACGHDGHTSMLVGAAALLLAEPPPLPVRLLFQPAEEHGTGADAMIADGALDGVAMIFGGHVDRDFAAGELVVTDGAVNASTDTFRIEVRGRQGHGARPHQAIDAVVVGAAVVGSLQTLVSRRIDPARPGVVTVGSFHAGTTSNVIAGTAVLEGTIRAQDPHTREQLVTELEAMARAVIALHGAEAVVEVRRGTPPLINAPGPTALARGAAVDIVGAEHVRVLGTANMGGEDFACYLQHIPGCYIRYGAQVPERKDFPAHSGGFDIHEDALPIGAAWLDRVARVAGTELHRVTGA